MSVVVARGSWVGVHGVTAVTVCAPALPPQIAAPVAVSVVEDPVVSLGKVQPLLSAGLLAAECQLVVNDPSGAVAAARHLSLVEADVYVDLEVPTGRTDGGPAGLRWRLLLGKAEATRALSPAVVPGDDYALDLRCGLGTVQAVDAGSTAGLTIEAVLRQALELGATDHADGGPPPRRILTRLPIAPSTGWEGPHRLRTTPATSAEGEPLGALTGEDGTAHDALRTLSAGMTLVVYQDPDPATWTLRPGGDAGGDWATERAPSWVAVGRLHQGDAVAAHRIDPTDPSAPPAAVAVAGDALALRAIDWGGRDTWGTLDPLRRLTFEATPGAAEAGVEVSGSYRGTPPEFSSGSAYVGSVTSRPTLVYRCRLQAGYGGDPSGGGGKLYLRLSGSDGTMYFGTASGWSTTVEPALFTLQGDGLQTADVPGALPSPGRVIITCPGDRNGAGDLVEYLEAEATLTDPSTGEPALIEGQVYRADVGFSGYADEIPLLPTIEVLDDDDVTWVEIGGTGPVNWRSASAETNWPRLHEAQAAERASQEVVGPNGPPRYVRAVLGVVVGPGTRCTLPASADEPDSPFAEPFAAVLVGARVTCGEGTAEALLTEVHSVPPAITPTPAPITDQEVPSAPSIVVQSGAGDVEVTVTTVEYPAGSGGDADAYRVWQRREGDQDFEPVGTVDDSGGASVVFDGGPYVDAGTEYDWYATTIARGVESAPSNTVTATA